MTGCQVTRTLHLSPMPVSPMLHTRSTSVRPDKFVMCAAVYRSSTYFYMFLSKLTLGSQPHMPERD